MYSKMMLLPNCDMPTTFSFRERKKGKTERKKERKRRGREKLRKKQERSPDPETMFADNTYLCEA